MIKADRIRPRLAAVAVAAGAIAVAGAALTACTSAVALRRHLILNRHLILQPPGRSVEWPGTCHVLGVAQHVS
jgi:hypothetical protein